MTVDVGRLSPRAVPVSVSPWSRIFGLGSVYAKTLRDSRRAILIMSDLMARPLTSWRGPERFWRGGDQRLKASAESEPIRLASTRSAALLGHASLVIDQAGTMAT